MKQINFSRFFISFGIIFTLAVIAFFTLTGFLEKFQEDRTLEVAEAAMNYAREQTNALGPITVDKQFIYAGETNLNNSPEVVNQIKALSGFGCTIFRGNIRISTTANKGTKESAIGKSANDMITDLVFKKGERFKGVTKTLDQKWLTIYEPLIDASNKRVGMIAVYQDYNAFLKGISQFKIIAGFVMGSFVSMLTILIFSTEKARFKFDLKNQELISQRNELKQLSTVVNEIDQTVIVIDPKDRILWVNKAFTEELGYASSEVIGEKTSDILGGPLTDRKIVDEITDAIFNKKQPISTKVIQYRKDKSTFWANLLLTPILDEQGNLDRYVAIALDISKEEQISRELEATKFRFDTISSSLSDVFYLFNVVTQKYEFISPNCYKLLGADESFFYNGRNHTRLVVHPDDKAKVLEAKNVVEGSESYDIEYRIIVNDKIRWIRERSNPTLNKDEKVIYNSGICSDITDTKNLKTISENAHNELLSSIRYAQRIQNATLTTQKDIDHLIPENFLVYKPKDIVSGDFYRVDAFNLGNGDDAVSIIVGDCTGHGVPGATLAILCSSLLKSSLGETDVNSPGEALDYARKKLDVLFKNKEDISISDGMDVAFCVYLKEKKQMYFSGAFSKCFIYRNGELIIYKGDRQHVGYILKPKLFTTHVIDLQLGDEIYFTTDGLIDQFGGPETRKFMPKRFFKIIEDKGNISMKEQGERIDRVYESWKGDLHQTDDVCVFGLKVT